MKKVCIVGYGLVGPIHAAAVNKTESARVFAVCDIDPQRRKACADTYGAIEYADFDEMLKDERVDSVHICTPHYLHFEMVKKALAAGKRVVCEKPVTITEDEFEELCKLDTERKVAVVLQNRYNPSIEAFKSLVNSGEMGKVKTAKAIVTWCRGAKYYAHDEWRGKWATEGGGVLINQTIHTLDYFCYLIGKVSSVKAQMINFSIPEIEVEDTMTAALSLECGARGVFFATNAYGDNTAPLFEIIFEKGTVRYEDGKLFVNENLKAEDSKPQIGKMYWGRGHEMLFEKIYDKGEYFSLDDVSDTMKTVFAIYKSAKSGGESIVIE